MKASDPLDELNRLNEASEDATNLTDLGNAQRLVADHGDDIRYCPVWKSWLVWDGLRWRRDDDGELVRRAATTVRRMFEAAWGLPDKERKKAAAWSMRSESAARIEAMIKLARAWPGVPIVPDKLDADPWLLNCQNGAIDLRTGELLEHDRDHFCTKLTPIDYDPDAECPVFEAFLERIFAEVVAIIDFLQRALGYSITGSTAEQCFFINHGGGANGKSTLLSIILNVLGEYSQSAAADLLLTRSSGGARNDVARLHGARFVCVSEIAANRKLAEGLLKEITGGDAVTARFLFQEEFDFHPVAKLWIGTNHLPKIQGIDDGIWRRIRLVPFEVTIPENERDGGLPQKLQAEAEGILAWLVQGCLDWQAEGLNPPSKVTMATNAYRRAEDILTDFLDEHTERDPFAETPIADLFSRYVDWAEEAHVKVMSKIAFGRELGDRGFEGFSGTGHVAMRRGLRLRDMTTGK